VNSSVNVLAKIHKRYFEDLIIFVSHTLDDVSSCLQTIAGILPIAIEMTE